MRFLRPGHRRLPARRPVPRLRLRLAGIGALVLLEQAEAADSPSSGCRSACAGTGACRRSSNSIMRTPNGCAMRPVGALGTERVARGAFCRHQFFHDDIDARNCGLSPTEAGRDQPGGGDGSAGITPSAQARWAPDPARRGVEDFRTGEEVRCPRRRSRSAARWLVECDGRSAVKTNWRLRLCGHGSGRNSPAIRPRSSWSIRHVAGGAPIMRRPA